MSVTNPTLIEIRDEGISQGRVLAVNFTGAAVTATVSGITATVNVTAGGGSFSVTRQTIVVPFPARYTQTITVVDGAISPTSRILVWESGLADSDILSQMDNFNFKAIPGTGAFLLRIETQSPFAGSMSIDYTFG